MTSLKEILPAGPASDRAALHLDAHLPNFWLIGDGAFCKLLGLPLPISLDFVISPTAPKEVFEAMEQAGVFRIEGSDVLKLVVAGLDGSGAQINILTTTVAELLVGARFVGDQTAIHLATGKAVVTPEFWNLPPETYTGEPLEGLPENIVKDLQVRYALFNRLHRQLIDSREQAEVVTPNRAEPIAIGGPATPGEGTAAMPADEVLQALIVPMPQSGSGSPVEGQS